MSGTDYSNAEAIVPEILACAYALNKGQIEEARNRMSKFKDYKHPLAKTVASRVLFYDDKILEGRQCLLDAIRLIGGRRGAGNDYIREYSKVFLFDFSSKLDLERQIKIALETNPSEMLLRCLPLFEDLDFIDLGRDENLNQ